MASAYDTPFQENIDLLEKVVKTSHNLRSDLKNNIKSAILGLTEIFNEMKTKIIENRIEQKAPCCERGTQTFSGHQPQENRPYPSYSEALKRQTPSTVSIYIKPTINGVSSSDLKKEIKSKIDPVELNVGVVKMLSVANGGLIVHTKTKQESEKLCTAINTVCSSSASAAVAKKRQPRVIIYNVPEELTMANANEVLTKQNPEVFSKGVQFSPKLILSPKHPQQETGRKKGYKHLVIECAPSIRKKLLSSPIKIIWSMCYAKDYLFVRRCYNCSLYHNGECSNPRSCPVCAKDHELRACNRSQAVRQCNGCLKHNEQSTSTDKVDTNHSAFDNHCPTYLRTVERVKRTINYNEYDE